MATTFAPITSDGALSNTVNVVPLYNAGAFAPSTITSVVVPVKSTSSKRVLTAPSLSLDIKVIAALSAGLLASAGSIVIFTSLVPE